MEKKYPIGIEPNASRHQAIIVKVRKAHGVKSLELTTKHIALMSDCISEYIAQQAPTGAAWVKATTRLPEKSGYYHVKRKVVKSTEQEKDVQYYHTDSGRFSWDNVIEWLDESPAPAPSPDELWDEFSEYIDDDIDSLTKWAGSTVIDKDGWKKMWKKWKGE